MAGYGVWPYGRVLGFASDGIIGYGGVVGCLAVPAFDCMLDGIESGQPTGPSAGAGWLKDLNGQCARDSYFHWRGQFLMRFARN